MKIIILVFLLLSLGCTSQMQSDSTKNTSLDLTLETKATGDGVQYDDVIDLDIEDTLTIYAILRNSSGEFVENAEVSWSLGEGVGELLLLNKGKAATFSSTTLGSNTTKVFKDNVLVKTYTLNVKVLVPRTLTVEDVYPLNGNWNDYIKNDDPAKDWYSQGVASFNNDPSLFDWFNFESRFRAWGNDGGNFPDAGNLGACTAGTCRIWDYRVPASDTLILNQSSNSLSENEDFLPSMPCPQAVDGNNVITNNTSVNTQSTYLVNAIEVMEDSIGNDNGLCESNESCIYSPNIGAYQGEGDFKSNGVCAFQDGTVSGVTMYAYPINGLE